MRQRILPSGLFAGALLTAALPLAPAATAVPECAQVGITTTLCQGSAHSSLTTYPAPIDYGPWPWWVWDGPGVFFGW